MNKPTYRRAYAEMLDYILQFASNKAVEANGKRHSLGISSNPAFLVLDYGNQYILQPGDLVLVTAANTHKFRLSWFLDQRKLGMQGDFEYLLKSVQDGEECWWSNIGLCLFTREKLSPTWRWDDEQFAFYDRWRKACMEQDAYIYLPKLPEFDGDMVTLRTRVRHSISDFSPGVWLVNWKNATVSSLASYYQELVALHHKHEKERQQPK